MLNGTTVYYNWHTNFALYRMLALWTLTYKYHNFHHSIQLVRLMQNLVLIKQTDGDCLSGFYSSERPIHWSYTDVFCLQRALLKKLSPTQVQVTIRHGWPHRGSDIRRFFRVAAAGQFENCAHFHQLYVHGYVYWRSQQHHFQGHLQFVLCNHCQKPLNPHPTFRHHNGT